MIHRLTTLCLVLLLGGLTALPASAWLPDPAALLRHRQTLSLTGEQVAQLQALQEQGEAGLARLESQTEAAEARLDALLQTVPLDVAAARAAGQALLDQERTMKRFILDVLLDAHGLLDQDQRRLVLSHLQAQGAGQASVYRRIEDLAEQIRDAGGDIGDLPERLRRLRQDLQAGRADEAQVLALITELEERLGKARQP